MALRESLKDRVAQARGVEASLERRDDGAEVDLLPASARVHDRDRVGPRGQSARVGQSQPSGDAEADLPPAQRAQLELYVVVGDAGLDGQRDVAVVAPDLDATSTVQAQ